MQIKNAREKKVVSRKEEYRKKAKRKVIQTMIKRNKKKAAIHNVLFKNTSVQGTIGDDDADINFKITAPEENDSNDDDSVTYVKYIPPPLENPSPLMHLCETRKQKLKQIREHKERY